MNAAERCGNLFLLLCILHTNEAGNWLIGSLYKDESDLNAIEDYLKLYLAMEEWFRDTDTQEEVQ